LVQKELSSLCNIHPSFDVLEKPDYAYGLV